MLRLHDKSLQPSAAPAQYIPPLQRDTETGSTDNEGDIDYDLLEAEAKEIARILGYDVADDAAIISIQKPCEMVISVLSSWFITYPAAKKSTLLGFITSSKKSPHQFVEKILDYFKVNKQLDFNDCAIYLSGQYQIALKQKIIVEKSELANTLQTLCRDLQNQAGPPAYPPKLTSSPFPQKFQ